MKYLLDTHFVIWVPIDDYRIFSSARGVLTNAENEFLFSAASLGRLRSNDRNCDEISLTSRV